MGRRAKATGVVRRSRGPVAEQAEKVSAWWFARCADLQKLLLVCAFCGIVVCDPAESTGWTTVPGQGPPPYAVCNVPLQHLMTESASLWHVCPGCAKGDAVRLQRANLVPFLHFASQSILYDAAPLHMMLLAVLDLSLSFTSRPPQGLHLYRNWLYNVLVCGRCPRDTVYSPAQHHLAPWIQLPRFCTSVLCQVQTFT